MATIKMCFKTMDGVCSSERPNKLDLFSILSFIHFDRFRDEKQMKIWKVIFIAILPRKIFHTFSVSVKIFA